MVETLNFVNVMIVFIFIFLVIIVSNSYHFESVPCKKKEDCPKIPWYDIRCRKGYCVVV